MSLKTMCGFVLRCTAVVAVASFVSVGLAPDANAKSKKKNIAVERSAAVTGLAASHDLRREGNRLCFSDHFHYGSSAGKPNQAVAQASAIESWSSFVDFEYGSAWASYGRSSSKELKCSNTTAGWGCEVSARPCK